MNDEKETNHAFARSLSNAGLGNQLSLRWEVLSLDQKGSAVYVIAATAERALACGKYWRRVMGFPRAKKIIARRYYPERDVSISTWVMKVPNVK